MARQKFEKSFNTFVKGLMTEASELNFPEDFSLYEKNFDLRRDGGRDRRRGMELVYPLGVMLTSKPYMIVELESIDASAEVSKVKFWEYQRDAYPENAIVGASAEISRIQLRSLVLDMEAPAEAIGASASIGGIRLRDIITNLSTGLEQASASANISRVYLSRVLVPYTGPDPESLSPSANITRIYLNEA